MKSWKTILDMINLKTDKSEKEQCGNGQFWKGKNWKGQFGKRNILENDNSEKGELKMTIPRKKKHLEKNNSEKVNSEKKNNSDNKQTSEGNSGKQHLKHDNSEKDKSEKGQIR